MNTYIHETAVVKESSVGAVKLFRNAVVKNSVLPDGCSIGDDTTIERCVFEGYVTINRRSYVNDSYVGAFTYSGINTTINWTKIGKFCSLARNVDIGGFDHDYHKVTTMPEFRFQQLLSGGGTIPKKEIHKDYCEIGNDVWIAAGAQILHKVRIGDGAVIGGGAVVTHDVPPYAVVAGVPARIIGYRCAPEFIEDLLEIKWWDWDLEMIIRNSNLLINSDINKETIQEMRSLVSN